MKHSFFISCLLFVFGLCTNLNAQEAQEAQQPKRKKVAVVLSGGGAKGMAHIGVLKVLEKAGIPVDIITGTSMGSIVGGLYAIGNNAYELDSIVRLQDWDFVLSDKEDLSRQSLRDRERQNTYILTKSFDLRKKSVGGGGIIEGKNLDVLFNNLTRRFNDSIDFNKLPIPFACVATNIIDNTEYVFHSGYVSRAMRASMAIPGVFAPVRMGDMVLVDGGLRNNYPADIAREMGADYVIGVTLQGEPKTADDLSSAGSVIGQIVDINCKNKFDDNLKLTDIHIHVNTKGYSTASFNTTAIDSLIDRGELAALQHWSELMTLKKELGLSNRAPLRPRMMAPHLKLPHNSNHKVSAYRFQNMSANDEKFIRSKFNLKDGDSIDDNRAELIATSIRMDLFYKQATTSFSKVDDDSDAEVVTFIAGEEKTGQGGLAVRFDNEEHVALQINVDYPFRRLKVPTDVDMTIRLGKRVKGTLTFALHPRSFVRPNFSYSFMHNDIDSYEKGKKQSNLTYNQHRLNLSLFNYNLRNFNFDMGVTGNFYRYKGLLINERMDTMVAPKNNRLLTYYAQVNYNSENDWYFATRGARFFARFAYYTDNFTKLEGEYGTRELEGMWRWAFPINSHWSLQPQVYGRLISGVTCPLILRNAVGGQWFGHYVDQQMPFPGVMHVELVDNKFAAAQMQAQYRLKRNNIFQLRGAVGQMADHIKDIFKTKTLYGVALSYYYDTRFGPLGGSVGYSNKSKSFDFFINLGFVF